MHGVFFYFFAKCAYSLNYLKQYPLKKCDTIWNDDDKKSEQHRLGRSSHEQEQKQDSNWVDIEDDDEDQDEDENEELGPDRCLSGGRYGQRLSALSSRGKKSRAEIRMTEEKVAHGWQGMCVGCCNNKSNNQTKAFGQVIDPRFASYQKKKKKKGKLEAL